MKIGFIRCLSVAGILSLTLTGCVTQNRMGMVTNPKTGLMYGSVVQGSTVTDSSLFKNRKMKIRIRNTSGDPAFNLKRFKNQIENSYSAAGYEPTTDDDFGLLLNVNVMYSGHIQNDLSSQFAFLGGAAGGIQGYRSKATGGTAIGVISGATIGNIIGSFITDDTYIIVAEASFSVIKNPKKREGKTIRFSRSVTGHIEDADEKEERRTSRSLKRVIRNKISVYAGGRNVSQKQIADGVTGRFVRIISDII